MEGERETFENLMGTGEAQSVAHQLTGRVSLNPLAIVQWKSLLKPLADQPIHAKWLRSYDTNHV